MRYLASVARHVRVLDQQLVAVVVEVADDRDADAQVVELAPDLRHGAPRPPSLLTVTRTSSEPAWASAATWSAVASAIGGVGVGHRLDDDRVARADQHAADVDGGRLPATGQVRLALDAAQLDALLLDRRAASGEPLYVEERDPHEQRHEQR